MQGPLHLCNELLRSTPEDQSARLGLWAIGEQVEALSSNLSLFERATCAKMLRLDVGASRLDVASNGLDDALQIVVDDSAGTKNVSVGKVLGRQITNG
jgi:hypothetical protein